MEFFSPEDRYFVNKDNKHAISLVEKLMKAPSSATMILVSKEEMNAYISSDIVKISTKLGEK